MSARTSLALLTDSPRAIQLRPYQVNALQLLRYALARGVRRLMLYSPTGSGKTEIAFAMLVGALAKGRRVVFIVNRKELVRQTSRRLAAAGIDHGIYQADNSRDLGARVLVASIDTIHARGIIPGDVDLFVIDEAHACAGSTKYQALMKRYNAVPTVGLSATPFTVGLGKNYDELGGALFQELVEAVTIRELIDQGFLVDVDCFAPADPDLTGVKTQKGVGGEVDYNEKQLAAAMNKPSLTGDVIAHWLRLARGKQTVIFAVDIAHSMALVAAFLAAGVPAEHIDYHADDDERAAILGRFARGETMVLSNSVLLSEGWDCPAVECMVLARPTKSLTRYVQMVGRVLRPFHGKEKALLLDHSGTVLRLGFATDDLPLHLDDGKPNKAGKQEQRKSEPSPCPKCKYVRPAGVHACPACGFAPTRQSDVHTVEGELVKLDRKKPIQKQAGQFAYSQLLGYAEQHGFKTGWAYHQYAKMFDGRHPNGLRQVAVAPTPEILGWIKSQNIRFNKGRAKGGHHGAA